MKVIKDYAVICDANAYFMKILFTLYFMYFSYHHEIIKELLCSEFGFVKRESPFI